MIQRILFILKYVFLIVFISTGFLMYKYPNTSLVWLLSIHILYLFIGFSTLHNSFKNNIDITIIKKQFLTFGLGFIILMLIFFNLWYGIELLFAASKEYSVQNVTNFTI